MNPTIRRLAANWIVGSMVGTAVIAITSPLFVRSYAPLHFDPAREVWTLPPGQSYRWRSEGYATTRIGPHGMPGRTGLPEDSAKTVRVALWGDSQAEGVCVADEDKLFAQADRLALDNGHSIAFLSFARSGDDAAKWLPQFPLVERELGIDLHALLIVELADLRSASDIPPRSSQPNANAARSAIAAWLPSFVIQAARYLITDADDRPRRLRFAIGPTGHPPTPVDTHRERVDWPRIMTGIRAKTAQPIVILYAPLSPHVVAGTIVLDDAQSAPFTEMKRAAESQGMVVVDVRPGLRASAAANRWPHGFHNGNIGSGHLNATGYHVIAERLVPAAVGLIERKD